MRTFWKAGLTRRYHAWQIIGEQTVAAHSWGVAKIVMHLWPDSRIDLLKAALDHDLMEHFTGDTPSPTKKQFPELAAVLHSIEAVLEKQHGIAYDLTAEEKLRLKAADMLEAMLFAKYQLALGNSFCSGVWENLTTYLTHLVPQMLPEDQQKVMNFMLELRDQPL